jgi:hypothetical protein
MESERKRNANIEEKKKVEHLSQLDQQALRNNFNQ